MAITKCGLSPQLANSATRARLKAAVRRILPTGFSGRLSAPSAFVLVFFAVKSTPAASRGYPSAALRKPTWEAIFVHVRAGASKPSAINVALIQRK